MEILQRNLSAKAKDSRSGLWNKPEDADPHKSGIFRSARVSKDRAEKCSGIYRLQAFVRTTLSAPSFAAFPNVS